MCIYRIAGNFQGVKFSRIRSKRIFMESNFVNGLRYSQPHPYIKENFAGLNFMDRGKSTKKRKFHPSKIMCYIYST